jgi:tetratricopeptide (TPR) repeat protein
MILICGACLVCLSLIKPVQDRMESRLQAVPGDPDLLYFSSPSMVKALALGYESMLGDLYWMRVIQYYGRRDEAEKRPVRYGNLAALLDITTTLDPDLIDAFRAGSVFLSEAEPIGAGQPHEAVRLLDKGIRLHPDDWRLRFDKGMVYFWHLRDFKTAGTVWIEASRMDGAPFWMASLAALALSKGGQLDAAIALWQREYQEAGRADVRANARNHLLSFQVAEQLWTLEFLVGKFREIRGVNPSRLEDLVEIGWLREVPPDPTGTPYEYDRTTGRVKLSRSSKVAYLEVPDSYKEPILDRVRQALALR